MVQKIVVGLILLVIVIFVGLTIFKPQFNLEDEPGANEVSIVEKSGEYQTITPEVAKPLIGTEEVILIDVRTQEEYDAGHIPGSILLPVDEIEVEISNLEEDTSKLLILYCRSGNRSKRASHMLLQKGYTNVHDLGGIMSWPYEVEQ